MDQPGGVATRDLHRRVHRPRNRCGRPDTLHALDDWSADGRPRNALAQSRAVMWRASPVAASCSLPDYGACPRHRQTTRATVGPAPSAPFSRIHGDDAVTMIARACSNILHVSTLASLSAVDRGIRAACRQALVDMGRDRTAVYSLLLTVRGDYNLGPLSHSSRCDHLVFLNTLPRVGPCSPRAGYVSGEAYTNRGKQFTCMLFELCWRILQHVPWRPP